MSKSRLLTLALAFSTLAYVGMHVYYAAVSVVSSFGA